MKHVAARAYTRRVEIQFFFIICALRQAAGRRIKRVKIKHIVFFYDPNVMRAEATNHHLYQRRNIERKRKEKSTKKKREKNKKKKREEKT